MTNHAQTCRLTQTQLLDLSFMEHRAHLLAIAAFLDRLERAQGAEQVTPQTQDFRLRALKEALHELTSDTPGRVIRAQLALSDRNVALLESRDSQSAFGANRHADHSAELEGGEQ